MDPYDVPTATDALRTELMARERLLHFPAWDVAEQFAAGVVAGYWEVGASGGRFDVDVIWDVVRRRAAGDPSAYGDLGADHAVGDRRGGGCASWARACACSPTC